jgi:hypothetical protein
MENISYRNVEFMAGDTIEDAINELKTYHEKGIKVNGSFNGKILYSDSDTIDSAYIKITGKTKIENDRLQQEWLEEYKRKEKEHKEKIPELIKEWVAKGKEILSEDKWELWEKCVPMRLNDLYKGFELGCCLEIIKALNTKTFEDAKKIIDEQDHSGMSFGLICSMLISFSDKGKEFVEYIK